MYRVYKYRGLYKTTYSNKIIFQTRQNVRYLSINKIKKELFVHKYNKES